MPSVCIGYGNNYGHGEIEGKTLTGFALAWNERGEVRNFRFSVEFYSRLTGRFRFGARDGASLFRDFIKRKTRRNILYAGAL